MESFDSCSVCRRLLRETGYNQQVCDWCEQMHCAPCIESGRCKKLALAALDNLEGPSVALLGRNERARLRIRALLQIAGEQGLLRAAGRPALATSGGISGSPEGNAANFAALAALRLLHEGDGKARTRLALEVLGVEGSRLRKPLVEEFDGLEVFLTDYRYTTSFRVEVHPLFMTPFITLYPVEKPRMKREVDDGRGGKVTIEVPDHSVAPRLDAGVHRPILEVEWFKSGFRARCYLALFAPSGDDPSRKDVVADPDGNITIQQGGLMNLGNAFKALLWCEDYLANAEHYRGDARTAIPNPVIRSFLVPLCVAGRMMSGDPTFARPLDQSRGSGQFGSYNKGALPFSSESMVPVRASLVSFVLDVRLLGNKPPGQQILPMPALQEYVTGVPGLPCDLATGTTLASQHNRVFSKVGKGSGEAHAATFGGQYQHVLEAYYDYMSSTEIAQDTTESGFKYAKVKAQFPNVLEYHEKLRADPAGPSGAPQQVDGMNVVPIPDDGHCLFGAIGKSSGNSPAELRTLVRDFYKTTPAYVQGQQIDANRARDIGLQHGPIVWGGDEETIALASLLGREIHVHRPGQPPMVIDAATVAAAGLAFPAQANGPPIHILLRADGAHYDALV